ncbi:M56 family metallopeptidase [Mucilaginibacter sp. dw_454]|uniref:M56 family metallopeptidase n=1 Tax=Mucilaginibacter sp. dw_454 TaxID=2720079 RepID=UPI001BD4AA40|nr:M56 family metallopeptidase [Mucilaginibacter sp. dw_454]
MEFLTITSFATDRLVGALCNTLVHSLWQGLILAAVTGLIVLLTRKSSAALRYNLLISALALFTVGVIITFATQMGRSITSPVNTVGAISSHLEIVRVSSTAPVQSFSESVFSYLNDHHNTIVLVWFLIICAKSIQLIVGLLGVRRLKHTNVHQVNIEWYQRLQQLAENLNINKSIALLESGLAKVPLVIGAFKPVILIPIGLITTLSIEEVEAILVHELAHIKRRDYLVNLLQSLMEIVFFFNPAVLWISQLIKTERENCCDDLAVAQSSNKLNYIRALVSCEEYQAAVPAYAMGFAGDKNNNLVSRVKRMVSNRNHTLNLFEKTALAICLVISGLCLSAFSQRARIHRITDAVAQAISHREVQSLKPAKPVVLSSETKKLAQQTQLLKDNSGSVQTLEDVLQPLGVNSTGCGPCDSSNMNLNTRLDTIKTHLGAIDTKHVMTVKVDPGVEVNVPAGYKYAVKAAPNAVVKVDAKGVTHVTSTQKMNVTANAKVNVIANSQVSANTNSNVSVTIDTPVVHAETHDVVYSANGQANYEPNRPYNASSRLNTSIPVYSSNITGNYVVSRFSVNMPDTNKKPKAVIAKSGNTSWVKKTNTNLYINAGDLGSALYDAHLIKDKKNYKVTLTNKEMVINGVKQPENIHQTYLKQYQKELGDKVDVAIAVTN